MRGLLGPDKFAEMTRAEFESMYGKAPSAVKDATPPSSTTNEGNLNDLSSGDVMDTGSTTSCDQPTKTEVQKTLDGMNEDDLQKFLDNLKF